MAVKTEKVSRVKQHTVYRTKDGTRVPGVTTILGVIAKPFLIKWANNLGLQGIDSSKYVDKLADVGTLAHAMIEHELGGPEVDPNEWSPEQFDMASNSVIKFLDWMKGHDIRVVDREMSLVSEEHRYGGTIDILAHVDGVLGITDIKTSKAIYDDHLFQVAAYYHLARENGHEVQEIRIVQVGRSEEEGFTVRTVRQSEIFRYWKVFEDALSLYRSIQTAKRKAA